MPCHFGRNIVICRRGYGGAKLRQPCYYCPTRHEALCDWPAGDGKTCDRMLCRQHRARQGGDVDYCPEHAAIAARKMAP